MADQDVEFHDPAAAAPSDRVDERWQRGLVKVFDDTSALDQTTKDRIRHRVITRIAFMKQKPMPIGWGMDIVSLGGLVLGFAMSLILTVYWIRTQPRVNIVGAGLIAFFIFAAALWISALNFDIDSTLFRYGSYLTLAALTILALRTLPVVSWAIPMWIIAGLRAGLIGYLIAFVSQFVAEWMDPIFTRKLVAKQRRIDPDVWIVVGLLELLSYVEGLDKIRTNREDWIVRTMTLTQEQQKWRAILQKKKVEGFETREMFDEKEQDDDTVLHTVNFEFKNGAGSWESLHRIEQVLPDPARFSEFFWKWGRNDFLAEAENVAQYLEQGLTFKLAVRDVRINAWLNQELHKRAQAIRNWKKELALPSQQSYQQLLVQIGNALELAVDERWAALPSHDEEERESFVHRTLQIARRAAVGVVPLILIFVASKVGILTVAVRDAVLTFAIPWLLLQLLELLVPNAGDHLARSKTLRDLWSSRREQT